MTIAEIIKNQQFFKKVEDKYKAGKFLNSVMFFCNDSLTNEVVLVMTALMLNYPAYQLFDENSVEYKRVINNANIDIRVYPKNKEKLLVSDSEEIVNEVFIKPIGLEKKVFIIENFDESTEQAQNKLLKVLEEPPKNVYFLLGVKSAEKVLPTIKSRCDKFYVERLTNEELSKFVKNQLAVILSGGYICQAQKLANMDNLDEIVDFAIKLVTNLKNSAEVLQYSKGVVDRKDHLKFILSIYLLALEDMLKLKAEQEELCRLTPYSDVLKNVEPEFSTRAICEITSLIAESLKKVQFNANLPVAVDNLLLKILEVKYLCK